MRMVRPTLPHPSPLTELSKTETRRFQTEQKRHDVVRDLVDAVVRHVRHGHAELGCGVDGDVVDADAEPAHGHAVGSGTRSTAGVTCAKQVMMASTSPASDTSVSSLPSGATTASASASS